MKLMEKFIVFNQPDLGEEEMSSVMDVIRSGWIGTGKVAHEFEQEFARIMGGGYAVAVSSCTMGLQLALKALKIGKGDEVILPPLTFAATLNAVLSVGAYPVLVDVDKTGCLDIDLALDNIDPVTKAAIPVHYSGTPCHFGKLPHELPVVEDCAHAFGSVLSGLGDMKIFSFYANKNITCGEGGMVLAKSKSLADDIRVLSSQGLTKGSWERYGKGTPRTYSVEKVGLKGNLPDLLACVGLVQLRRWPEMKAKRLKVFNLYENAFGKMPLGHSTHFYPLRVKNRDDLRSKLHSKGIGTGIHYKPLHLEPAYGYLGYKKGDFPMAEAWGEEELSLPVSSNMTEEDAERIVKEVKELR